MSLTVIAVVVTYNRKELLARCLDALLHQSHPVGKIIIIDNASTDGTSNFLENHGYIDSPLIDYRLLDENIGGAGGFFTGVREALVNRPNYVWLMDDDGWPGEDCLKELTEAHGLVRGPIVIDDSDNSRTAFAYKKGGVATKDMATLSNSSDLMPVHPFNGVLLSSDLIEDIGLPDPRFFIWGDELDYRARWLSVGCTEVVVSSAKFYHPSDRQVILRSNSRSLGVPVGCSTLRRYCYYRNQTFLSKTHVGILKTLGKVAFSLRDIITSEKDKHVFIKGVVHGITEKFGLHKQFIN